MGLPVTHYHVKAAIISIKYVIWASMSRHPFKDILQGILTNSPGLAAIVGPAPKMVAHWAKNLGDMLIQSEFIKFQLVVNIPQN